MKSLLKIFLALASGGIKNLCFKDQWVGRTDQSDNVSFP